LEFHRNAEVVVSFATIPSALKTLTFLSQAGSLSVHDGNPLLSDGLSQVPVQGSTTEPQYLLRDRGRIYGEAFKERAKAMGLEEAITAPRSPWQNPFAERLLGTIRRDGLNHVIVLGEAHLRRTSTRYFRYYHNFRTHLPLEKDAPAPRAIQDANLGDVIEVSEVGGLHHHCERRAA
jgi:putative transposase